MYWQYIVMGSITFRFAIEMERSHDSCSFRKQMRKALGVSHVRGLLLHGPPGCGKTLLARELSRRLGARPPKLVSGPEILDKVRFDA